MISACAALLSLPSSLLLRGSRPSLISPTSRRHPLSRDPSLVSPPPFPPLPSSLLFFSSPIFLLVRRPSFAFPFLFSRLSLSSFSRRTRGFCPSYAFPRHQTRLSVTRRFPFLLSRLCRSVSPPFDTAAHCSRLSRIAEVKPSDDFLAGTWFHALLFFLSISLSLSLSFRCPSQKPLLPMTRSGRRGGEGVAHDR